MSSCRPGWAHRCGVVAVVIVLAGVMTGCAAFEIETPDEMIAVEDGNREYVAMTHDGVVLRVKVLSQGDSRSDDVPSASRSFWVEATREQMRHTGGYALLDEVEVTSNDGHTGTRLEFGRDQQGKNHIYWLTIFSTDDEIHVIDAGGPEEQFEGARDAIERALASYQVKE